MFFLRWTSVSRFSFMKHNITITCSIYSNKAPEALLFYPKKGLYFLTSVLAEWYVLNINAGGIFERKERFLKK